MTARMWSLLALVLALCAPPLCVRVGEPDPVRIMESLSFLTSQETWLRLHQGESSAWRMPSWNGAPRVQKPPMLVWMNLLAWTGLEPGTAGVDRLTRRARAVAVGFALLTLAATYAAGMTLGGRPLAALGTLVTGSSLLFIRQSRVASYDTHLMGWTTLAVAAALWAMAGGRTGRRWVCGGGLALLALAAGCYTKGPLALALVLGPLGAMAATRPAHRARDGLFVLALGLAAAALLAPWFAAAAHAAADARTALDREYRYILEAFHNPFHYVGVLALVFPWTLWLAAALARTPPPRAERTRWWPWLWFVVLFVLFSCSPMKNKRYIVPILPAAGLLTAQLWIELAGAAARPRWARVFRVLHGAALAAGSALLPLSVLGQGALLRHGLLDRPFAAAPPAAWSLVALAGLGLLAALEIRAHARDRWMRAGWLTALWMLAAATYGFAGYARAEHQRYPYRAEAEAMARDRTPLFFVSNFVFPAHQARPSDEFLIFYRGTVPATDLAAARQRVAGGEAFRLLTRVSPAEERALEALGLARRGTLPDGRPPDWQVWEAAPAADQRTRR